MRRTVYGLAVLLGALLTACGSGEQNHEMTTAATPACDPVDISGDLGREYTVVRCHADWALIDIGGLGDTHSLARLVDGKWTSYTPFPTSICQSKAKSDGVPEQELPSFRPC